MSRDPVKFIDLGSDFGSPSNQPPIIVVRSYTVLNRDLVDDSAAYAKPSDAEFLGMNMAVPIDTLNSATLEEKLREDLDLDERQTDIGVTFHPGDGVSISTNAPISYVAGSYSPSRTISPQTGYPGYMGSLSFSPTPDFYAGSPRRDPYHRGSSLRYY